MRGSIRGANAVRVERTVASPRGKTYQVSNITAFARKHKLDRSSLSRLVNGIRQTHKNWTLVG